jgi:hypothetical protein
MRQARKLAKTKLNANGKIIGRPVKRSKVAPSPPTEPKPVRWKRNLKRLRDPELVDCPFTGEKVRPFGPQRPVYEWRAVKKGRPPVKDVIALLRIIQAIQSEGKRGTARLAAEQAPHREELSVKRERTRTRREMRRRAAENL